MLSYDELTEQNRKLEALLAAERDRSAAERDRAADEKQKREAAEEQRAIALRQLDDMRKLYAILQQEHELLRRRIFEAKAERTDATQLELEVAKTKAALDKLQDDLAAASAATGDEPAAPPPSNPRPKKSKPKGRRNLDESTLPRESIVVPDPVMEELVAKGGAEIVDSKKSSRLMYRRSSFVVLETKLLTYRLLKSEGDSATTLVTAQAPLSIIERSIGTPSLFAHIVVDKFERGLPLYRQEEEFGQLGVSIDRGAMSRWLEQLGATVGATVIEAMRKEAFATAMCLSTDATGILVQRGRDPTTKARRPCKKGHFFVQIADRDAVFFEYAERETSAAVLKMFRDFSGYIQADAKNVFDILFREPAVPPDPDESTDSGVRKEVGCWAHARRYFFEAAAVAKESVAREALMRIRRFYELDDKWKSLPPAKRKAMRDQLLRPELDSFFDFARQEHAKVKHQRGLLRSALVYVTNHQEALYRFLEDGRLKLDNNASERALRKVAIGRKNWLFVGSDDHANSTANLLSMVASAKLHDLDPEAYLRDLFRVLPHWPKDRYLELAPKHWSATRARLDPKQLDDEVGALTIPELASVDVDVTT